MSKSPPAVRILPMDSKVQPGFVGCGIDEVQQQFFLRELARSTGLAGRFDFQRGLKAMAGTVVLFQYRGKIIASAILTGIVKSKASTGGGAFLFDVDSIRVFDPVDVEGVGKIWPEVARLGQAKWNLDPSRFAKFERQLTGIETPV